MMNRRLICAISGGAFGLAALFAPPVFSPGHALAQTGDGAVQPTPAEPKKTVPEKIAPAGEGIPRAVPESGSTAARPGETLGEKLDRTEGVMKPREGIDPNMTIPPPTPTPGTTPVIPPPGSPGNPSNVRPK